MIDDFFSVKNFNVIEDDENYYFFRALEACDIDDEKNGKISQDAFRYNKLRTYRERYNESHTTPSRYQADSKISLDEVYSHIKKNFYPGTNCISFSSNCNVSIDYGSGIDKYVMIKVPKSGDKSVYNAGQYMLTELNKELERIISRIPNQDDLVSIIRNMEQLDSSEKVIETVKSEINNYNYVNNSENLLYRFQPKQFFNYQQQLAYNKIIAKLTLLEISGNVKKILPRTSSNSSLISTISMAYSSSEIINYGDKFSSQIVTISKTNVELLALLQQAEDFGFDKSKIKILKRKVLEYAKQGFDLKVYNGILGYGNNERFIPFSSSISSVLLDEKNIDLAKSVSIEDVFNLSDGKISYFKGKRALDFAVNLSLAKEKNYELCELLKLLSSDVNFNDLIDEISKTCFSVNSNIINRRNNSGYKLCESVNIDMNSTREKIYSVEEQKKMISYIGRMDRENLRNILLSNGLNIEKDLCENILESGSWKDINRFFAEAIVDFIDFEKIYGVNNSAMITASNKEMIISKLEQGNCRNLYNVFKKHNKSNEQIAGYIINLLIDNGFKGYDFNKFSNLENIDDIISKNINNLREKIHAVRFDKLLGIVDNENYIAGTSINLRDYQKDTVDNIDVLFQEKKFAGVILPTGAGKSFVAMAEMLKYKDKNIIYYAPNREILNQIAKHILKHILNMSNEEIQKIYSEDQVIPQGKFLPATVDALISRVFPHLKLYCYQGLTTKNDDFFESHDADLIIFDELHRAGATEWNNKIRKLVNCNKNAKLLGITATPVRDVDRQDMMLKFAELSGDFSKKELMQKKYLCSEMYLIDAMQDGIVVIPNLVAFDYTLENSEEFKEVKTMYELEKDEEKKSELKRIYDQMRNIIENSQKKGMSAIINEAFEKNHKRKNGKYIVFLPINADSNIATEEYLKQEIEKVKEYFAGIDSNPEISYLLSNREKVSDNAKALSNFEKESDHLKLIFAINMLNEGVHVNDIDGIVMLRPISANTKILYSQQVGRCVYSLDPLMPLDDDKIPLIFDVYNNYLEQNMDREVNKSNTTSDLQRMKLAVNWIKRHNGYFPDINSDDNYESRKAVTLKKIQIKYLKYLDGEISNNFTPSEQYEIEEIISLGNSIDLWNRVIPEKILLKEDKEYLEDISRVNAFKLTGEQKRFIDLYHDAKKVNKSSIKVGNLRIKTALSVLELLAEYGVDINNETVKIDSTLKDVIENLSFESRNMVMEELGVPLDYMLGEEYNYVKEMFYLKHRCFLNFDLRDLRNAGIFQPFTKEKNGKPITLQSVDSRGFITRGCMELRNLNIYTSSYYDLDGLDINGYDEQFFFHSEGNINKYGFDRNGIHVKTKTKLNEFGFAIDGNYYFMNKDGKYECLGKCDPYDFDIDGFWYKTIENKKTGKLEKVKTNEIIDEHGYNASGINKHNFGRDGFYYIKTSDGKYKSTGKKTNNYGFAANGLYLDGTRYDKHGFNFDGMHLNGSRIDNHYFDRDGYYWREYFSGERVETTSKFNNYGFDRDGYYWKKLSNGKYEKTNNKFNDDGFDIDGYYWRLTENGIREKTREKRNDDGFNIDGINLFTNERFDRNGLDIHSNFIDFVEGCNGIFGKNGYYWSRQMDRSYKKTNNLYDERGFDRSHIHMVTNQKFDTDGCDYLGNYIANGISFFKDKNGYVWEKRVKSFVKTDKKRISDSIVYDYDAYGFDKKDGYYWKLLPDGTREKTDSLYDERGFDRTGFNIRTGEKWDGDGKSFYTFSPYSEILEQHQFGADGFYWQKTLNGTYHKTNSKYDNRGFNKEEFNKNTGEKWDEFGRDINSSFDSIIKSKCFGVDGFFWKRQDDKTYRKTDSRYNDNGRDMLGLNKYGFNRFGFYFENDDDYLHNNNRTLRYNPYGFDAHGINKYTNQKIDKYGFDIDKIHFLTGGYYDNNGFDIDGFYWELLENGTRKKTNCKYDERKFDRTGLNIKTGEKWDEYGLDISLSRETIEKANFFGKDGCLWKISDDGKCKKINNKYNNECLDLHGFDKNGIFVETGLDYDRRFFKSDGINVFTGTEYDINHFDIDGICQFTGDLYNNLGFDANGINRDTKTKYDKNGCDIFRNKPFDLNENSKLPFEVFVTKSFFEEMLTKPKKDFYKIISKRYGLKKISECDEKLNYTLFLGVLMCPELKKILAKQLLNIKFQLSAKKRELKKINSDLKENQEKISQLQQQISKLETYVTKYSSSMFR